MQHTLVTLEYKNHLVTAFYGFVNPLFGSPLHATVIHGLKTGIKTLVNQIAQD